MTHRAAIDINQQAKSFRLEKFQLPILTTFETDMMAAMKTFTRRSFLGGLVVSSLGGRYVWPAGIQQKRIFVGTYTHQSSKGIYAYRWTPESGELTELGLAAQTPSPSFLALSPDHKELFAVNELDTYNGATSGSVSAFSIPSASGRLSPKNVVRSGGTGPCNVAADHTGRVLFVANYDNGCAASFEIHADGDLSDPVTDIHYTGHSVNAERQEAAHTHCTTVSPDNRYVLINDLGLDRIMVYRFDRMSAKLTPNHPQFYSAIPGSGPRNLTFHPNRRWAYSVNEILSTVDGLNWDSANGTLSRFQNISTLPVGFKGESAAATVAVHPNGRFLYASNRGNDTIAAFSIHPANGHLTPMQHISCGGKFPRHFAVDPGGRWLVVANQNSANLVVLGCDPATGRLKTTGRQYPLDSPVCVIFE